MWVRGGVRVVGVLAVCVVVCRRCVGAACWRGLLALFVCVLLVVCWRFVGGALVVSWRFVVALVVCWLFGIAVCWRLGVAAWGCRFLGLGLRSRFEVSV